MTREHLSQLLIQAVNTARDLPEARPETITERVLADAGESAAARPAADVAQAAMELRVYLGNADTFPDFAAMWTVVEFVETALAIRERG